MGQAQALESGNPYLLVRCEEGEWSHRVVILRAAAPFRRLYRLKENRSQRHCRSQSMEERIIRPKEENRFQILSRSYHSLQELRRQEDEEGNH